QSCSGTAGQRAQTAPRQARSQNSLQAITPNGNIGVSAFQGFNPLERWQTREIGIQKRTYGIIGQTRRSRSRSREPASSANPCGWFRAAFQNSGDKMRTVQWPGYLPKNGPWIGLKAQPNLDKPAPNPAVALLWSLENWGALRRRRRGLE